MCTRSGRVVWVGEGFEVRGQHQAARQSEALKLTVKRDLAQASALGCGRQAHIGQQANGLGLTATPQ